MTYHCVIRVAETSDCAVARGLSVKPELEYLGHWKTVQTQIRCHRMWHLIRVCTVCSNHRKLKVELQEVKG